MARIIIIIAVIVATAAGTAFGTGTFTGSTPSISLPNGSSISSTEFPSLQRDKIAPVSQAESDGTNTARGAEKILSPSSESPLAGYMPISTPLHPEYVYRYDALKNLDPDKIVHPGQFVATFILLANHGRINEAVAMVAPEAQPQLLEVANWIDEWTTKKHLV